MMHTFYTSSTGFGCIRIKQEARRKTAMGTRGKKTAAKKESDDDLLSKIMFAEYREENAKDLEREGVGNW